MKIPIISFLVILSALFISSFTNSPDKTTKVYKLRADSTGNANITMKVTANPDFSNTTSSKEFQSGVLSYLDKLKEIEGMKAQLMDEANKLMSMKDPSKLEKMMGLAGFSDERVIKVVDINIYIKLWICILLIPLIIWRFNVFRKSKSDWRASLIRLIGDTELLIIICICSYIIFSTLFNFGYSEFTNLIELIK